MLKSNAKVKIFYFNKYRKIRFFRNIFCKKKNSNETRKILDFYPIRIKEILKSKFVQFFCFCFCHFNTFKKFENSMY